MTLGIPLGGFVIFLLATTVLHAANAAPDAFLDQPLPSQFLVSSEGLSQQAQIPKSHVERLHNLHTALAKPIVLPDGLADFLAEKDRTTDWKKGNVLLLAEGWSQSLPGKPTLRAYASDTFAHLNLDWTFDPKQDAIVARFRWPMDDPRSGAELIQILGSTSPAALIGVSTNNPWQIAFNALLSKPENFARVWPLRFCADQRQIFSSSVSTVGMATGKIKDDAGAEHFLIVTDQAEMCNPGPEGSFAYYLFDLKGRFEFGGLNTIGYRCFADSAWLEADGRHLDVQTYNNGSVKRDSVFALEKGQLVRKEFLLNGLPPTAWQWTGMDSGASLFTVGPK
jgi:hypothetical protein